MPVLTKSEAMSRRHFEQYMPREPVPSPCGCADTDGEGSQYYYGSTALPESALLRLYGKSNGGVGMMMVIVIALVCLIIGFMCAKFDIPMRFFHKLGAGGGEMMQG